jgi:hypothetical protein
MSGSRVGLLGWSAGDVALYRGPIGARPTPVRATSLASSTSRITSSPAVARQPDLTRQPYRQPSGARPRRTTVNRYTQQTVVSSDARTRLMIGR